MKTTNSKRLLIFCTSTGWGGTEKNALLRAVELQKRGYVVQLVVSSDDFVNRAKEQKVDVIKIRRGGDLNPFSIYRYYQIVQQFKPTVLLLTLVKDYWLGSLAAYFCNVDKVFLYLGIERKPKSSIKYNLIYGKFITGIIVNSPVIKSTFLKYSSLLDEDQIHVVINGFETHPIQKDNQNELKDYLGLKDTDILLGCSGRLTEQKGFDLVPEVMKHISHLQNVYIAIAGEGELREQIEQKINTYHLEHRIFLLGFQKDLSTFYQGIDLFVLFSRYEGMANVLNEAMSYGNPVISTRVSGTEELLKHGELGDIVEREDIEGLAKSIESNILSGNHVKHEKYVQHIEQNYTLQKMIDRTEEIFSQDSKTF